MRRSPDRVAVLLLLFAFLFYAPSWAGPVPEAWKEYVELDQKHNIPFRKSQIMTAEQAAVVPIYHADIPLNELDVTEAKRGLPYELAQQIYFTRDGQKYVRVFVTEANKEYFKALKNKGYELKTEYSGTKLQSHSTYLIWNDKNPEHSAFVVKFQQGVGEDEANGYEQAHFAVKTNDAVQAVLAESRPKGWNVFPEPLAVTVTGGGKKKGIYSNTFRSVAQFNDPNGKTKLYPLHGLIGSPSLLKALAKARGMTVEQWKKEEYLPKLATYLADSHFNKGYYFAPHTQNLNLVVDPKTGRILSLIEKDMFDVAADRYIQDKNFPNLDLHPPAAYMNDEFFDPDAARAGEPGFHLGMYAAQSIIDITDNENAKRKYALLFLEAYKSEVEKILGKKITYSKEGERAIAALKDQDIFYLTRDRQYDQWEEARRALMRAAQDIYEGFIEQSVPSFNQKDLEYDQQKLKSLGLNLLKDGKIQFLDFKKGEELAKELENGAGGSIKFLYTIVGDRLIVRTKKDKTPIAISEKLAPYALTLALQSRLKMDGKTCRGFDKIAN